MAHTLCFTQSAHDSSRNFKKLMETFWNQSKLLCNYRTISRKELFKSHERLGQFNTLLRQIWELRSLKTHSGFFLFETWDPLTYMYFNTYSSEHIMIKYLLCFPISFQLQRHNYSTMQVKLHYFSEEEINISMGIANVSKTGVDLCIKVIEKECRLSSFYGPNHVGGSSSGRDQKNNTKSPQFGKQNKLNRVN